MITELVRSAAAIKITPSTVVSLNIERGLGEENGALRSAISKMDNDQKLKFATMLIETIQSAQYAHEAGKKKKAQEELVAVFGKWILKDEALTQSHERFFFSLTAGGTQFRAWYAPFGHVTRGHFDSCGQGCLFTAYSENREILGQWIRPLVNRKVEWKSSQYGTVWLGYAL